MNNKAGWMVVYVGGSYAAIALVFLVQGSNVISSNIDLLLIPKMIFAITVSSLMFAVSDYLEQFFIVRKQIKSLAQINPNEAEDEIMLHKLIQDANGIYNKAWKWIANFLYCAALASAVILIFLKNMPDNILSIGATILTFGVIIMSYGYREMMQTNRIILINNIWARYYQSRNEDK